VTEPQEQPADKVEPNPVDEKEPLPSPTTSVAVTGENDDATSPTSSRSIRRSEAERIAFLQADSRAQEVKPHEVFCRSCQKWIKLAINAPYVLANWQAHQQRCSGSLYVPRSPRPTPSKSSFSPSSRIATTERKIALLNDPQVKSCSPQSIHCRVCKSTVALDGAVDYDLTKWNEHKEKCVASVLSMNLCQYDSNVRTQNDSCSDDPSRVNIAYTTRISSTILLEYHFPNLCKQVITGTSLF
jgi:hypothetical protein